ncbi:MAG: D-2-hydroxyacid dehydrogenase [Chloroflexi bacterium]|nr:D-2-hydroxyacid dehydrogenase [Chloroflexota bacterium]MCY3938720.1 D-2-hydroxyacid dehydrogenase [Chloroflexota bacterium]
MKIVVGTPFLGETLEMCLKSDFPGVDFAVAYDRVDQRREIVDADGFLGWPDRETFLAANRLRWIHIPGMGLDRLEDVPEIAASNVVITNSPGPHAGPMADHAIGMILALAHRVRDLIDDQRAKVWKTDKYAGRMVDLNGATLGLFGLGGIGRAVAQRALAFGMEVYAVDPSPAEVPAGVRAVWGMDRLDELLAMSDWFVVTAPKLPELNRIIDQRRLGLMKPGANVIAISRGGIVDEEALAAALESGRLAGAALDVTEVEPLPTDSPLWDLENLILSPHASALTPAMYEGRRQIFRENLRRFIEDKPLAFVCRLGEAS